MPMMTIDPSLYGLTREEELRGQIAMIAQKHQRAFNDEIAPLAAELARIVALRPLRILVDSAGNIVGWPNETDEVIRGRKPN